MLVTDSLVNIVSGLGTAKDKSEFGRFSYRFLGKAELDAMYTSDWLAGSIVDAPCDDMTREWRQWKGGPRQIQQVEKLEKSLGVRAKVNLAMKQARQYGGSALLMGFGDSDPTLEVDPDSVQRGGLRFVHVLSRYEIRAGNIDRDPMSPNFGGPSYYELNSGTVGTVQIHPSRVVRFLGQTPLEMTYSVDGWGLSVLQRVYSAVRNAIAAAANMSSLTHESKVDVISVPGLNENSLKPEYQARLASRFALAAQGKSVNNMLLLDAAEKWDQKKISLSDLPNVVRSLLEIAAGAANMPVTRLLGTSAKGLNATGDGDIRHYYDTLSSRQEVEVGPALDRIDRVLVRSAIGAYPDSVSYEWRPLWQMTDAELSAISLQKAQTTQIYAALGVMSPKALVKAAQGQLVQDDTYPGLESILETETGEAAPLVAPAAKPVDPGKVVENIASNIGGLKE